MSDICMTVIDDDKIEALYMGLIKSPGSINGALNAPNFDESGEVVATQSLRVEYEGDTLELTLTCTNVTSCHITNGKMPLQVQVHGSKSVVMMLDVKEAGGRIGGWIRTTPENLDLLMRAREEVSVAV